MLKKEEILLIAYLIAVVILLTVFFVVFFYVFQKRKNKMLFQKIEAERKFEQEITNSRLEIQEQTLKNVGMELHDNIGQLLSVAKMQLNMLTTSLESSTKEQAQEIREVIGSSIKEVRSLSKSLNREVIGHIGLEKSVINELERFDRLKLLKTSFIREGEAQDLKQEISIVIFRIIQEFISNVIKHAKASHLEVLMVYNEILYIELKDNGRGFDQSIVENGSGLLNMKTRAALIGAELSLHSAIGSGTRLEIRYSLPKL